MSNMSKLTLSVDSDVIDRAKDLASQRGMSVSAIFSRFITFMSGRADKKFKLSPLAKKASGIAKSASDKPDRELLTDALLEKYGL